MTVQVPHVLENAHEVWAEYGVVNQPSMVFVAADGTWERHVGRQDPLDFLARANALYGR